MNQHHYWQDLLFGPVTEDLKTNIYELLKAEAEQFTHDYEAGNKLYTINADVPPQTNEVLAKELQQWYESDSGQQVLLSFIQDFWQLLHSRAQHSMPAHDARHALYKVPAFSIKYAKAEGITGFERVGLVGALGHDYGRWAEEHIFGNATSSVIHARMSFVLVREFISNYDIPYLLQQEILYSILRHTTGAKPEDNMIVKLVVTADRDQLIGSEIVLRLTHHKPGEKDLDLFLPPQYQEGEKYDYRHSVLQCIAQYYFSRLPGPLFSLAQEVRTLYKNQAIFLYLALGEGGFEKIFAHYANKKSSLTNFEEDRLAGHEEYLKHQDWIAQARPEMIDNLFYNELHNLLESLNACPNPVYREMVLGKLEQLDILPEYNEDQISQIWNQKARLAVALRFINEQKQIFDQKHYEELTQIAQDNTHDQWYAWTAQELLKKWM
jgi:hypothetical protein